MKQISFDIDKKIRLDEFLKSNHISKNLFLSIYKDDIFINGEHAKRNSKLKPGDKVTINLKNEENNYEPINLDIEVLYEDDDIFVLNKPDKLTMNTDGEESLANFVSYLFEQRNINQKVRFISRLDQDTSGVVMVAKNKIAQAYYQKT
ncbi:MAG: pseudouridine synthase, partial [Finegoldia magna]|nr:pseudouridine synthase [Finegoldia magna]